MTEQRSKRLTREVRLLRRALAEWPVVQEPASNDELNELLRFAEYHGLAGVIGDALSAMSGRCGATVHLREVARALDHGAHLEVLSSIDAAFAERGLDAVVLKGALFGERFYPRPSARVTGDTDLLVREADLEAAGVALGGLGYVAASGPEEARFRSEHFHLHYSHPSGLPLELHFHAYRGFARTMRSEPLVRNSVKTDGFHALRVLAPDDEVIYLATHAAAHKFGRWSWLFDLRLLVETLEQAALRRAAEKARALGFEHPLGLAARLLVDIMAMTPSVVEPLLGRGHRAAVAERLLAEPENFFARAGSRLLYTTILCSDATTSARWLAREIERKTRFLLARTS